MLSRLRIGVVGGGLAGMSAASFLAAEGARVCVFEKEKELGGRLGKIVLPLPGGGGVDVDSACVYIKTKSPGFTSHVERLAASGEDAAAAGAQHSAAMVA